MHDYQKNGTINIEYAKKAREHIHRNGDQEGHRRNWNGVN